VLQSKKGQRVGARCIASITLCCLLLFLASCSSSSNGASGANPIAVQQAPKANLLYVAIGASDTFGVGADDPQTQSWPADLATQMGSGVRLINLGIPSELLHDALNVEVPVALDSHPNVITVWLAVNDIIDNVSLANYSRDLDTLLTRLRTGAPQAKIAIANVPDLALLPYFSNDDTTALTTKVLSFNSVISTLAARHHVILVDIYQHLKELSTHPEYISSDGLHPSTLGYERIAELFYQALQSAINRNPVQIRNITRVVVEADGRPQGATPRIRPTPIPTMLRGRFCSYIVGTGAVRTWGGAPCGRPSAPTPRIMVAPCGRPSAPAIAPTEML
jgi:lysophospholipase L1-like esterase